MDVVYLDFNATTPLDPRVLDAMLPLLRRPSNAGSRTHSYGQQSKAALDAARSRVAEVAGIQPEDVVFTSGATESNNIALRGLADFGVRAARKHIISTVIEHNAVLEPLSRLARLGFDIDLIPVKPDGAVDAREVERRLRPDTLLVSVMHANNETGVIQPVAEISRLLKASQSLFHIDAAQTFGKDLSLKDIKWDLLSVSGHKIYGPQGIGALCCRRGKLDRRVIEPIAVGGGQERGFRPGTVPVALAVGLGKAAELARSESSRWAAKNHQLRQTFLKTLSCVDFRLNGSAELTQPHVVNLCFPGVDSEALMMALNDRVAVSNGSACTTSKYQPSHVLQAMGMSEEDISNSIRVSWGPILDEIPAQPFIDAVRYLRH